jgi:hypothetical protein
VTDSRGSEEGCSRQRWKWRAGLPAWTTYALVAQHIESACVLEDRDRLARGTKVCISALRLSSTSMCLLFFSTSALETPLSSLLSLEVLCVQVPMFFR